MVTVALLMGMAFASAAETTEVITDLSPLEGVNISTTSVLSGTRMNAYCSEIAKHKDGYNARMVKVFVDKMYYSTFFKWEALEDGRTVIFDDMYTGEYDMVGTFSVKWNEYTLVWNVFKTDSQEAINAGYKYLILFPYHAHGEGTPHMHMRYGNASIDYLVTDPSLNSWWPTCYPAADMDQEKLYEELMGGAKMMGTMLPAVK